MLKDIIGVKPLSNYRLQNEADLDPDVLYSYLTGEPLPTFEPALA